MPAADPSALVVTITRRELADLVTAAVSAALQQHQRVEVEEVAVSAAAKAVRRRRGDVIAAVDAGEIPSRPGSRGRLVRMADVRSWASGSVGNPRKAKQ